MQRRATTYVANVMPREERLEQPSLAVEPSLLPLSGSLVGEGGAGEGEHRQGGPEANRA
jgi:hypothetical protein